LSRPRLKMQQDIQILKQKCNAGVIAPCPCQVWFVPTHPSESSVSSDPSPKIARENALNRRYLSRGLLGFAKILYSLIEWHRKCCKSSRSKVEVTAWHTCSKVRKFINSAGNCWILLKFRTDFDHVSFDVPRTFKVKRSKVKVTACVWHYVPASKTL